MKKRWTGILLVLGIIITLVGCESNGKDKQDITTNEENIVVEERVAEEDSISEVKE